MFEESIEDQEDGNVAAPAPAEEAAPELPGDEAPAEEAPESAPSIDDQLRDEAAAAEEAAE